MLPAEKARSELEAAAAAFEEADGQTYLSSRAWNNYIAARWAVWFTSPLESPFVMAGSFLAIAAESLVGFFRHTVVGKTTGALAAVAAFAITIVSFLNYFEDAQQQSITGAWALVAQVGVIQTLQDRSEPETGRDRQISTNIPLSSAIETLLKNGIRLYSIQLPSTNLEGVRANNAKLSGANFRNALLNRADFSGALLSGANFDRAQLWLTNFRNAGLVGASFRNATAPIRVEIAPKSASPYPDVIFDYALANSVVFDSVGFLRPSFRFAMLTGADFSNASFAHPDFTNADLTFARFIGASFTGGSFANANISGTDFLNARGITQHMLDQAWASREEPPRNLPFRLTFKNLCDVPRISVSNLSSPRPRPSNC